MGAVGTGLFFLISGSVMCKTTKDGFVVSEYYKKRLTRIFLPLVLANLYMFSINCLLVPNYITDIKSKGIIACAISILGLFFDCAHWESIGISVFVLCGEWFTAVIIVVYLLFPILKYIFEKHRGIGTLIISLVFILNLKYAILTDSQSGNMSFSNGLMYFWLGMLFEEYKTRISKWMVSIVLLGVCVLYIFNPFSFMGIMILPAFVFTCLLYILLYQIKINMPLIRFISKYNYEIYLTHHQIYLVLLPMLVVNFDRKKYVLLAYIVLFFLICLMSKALKNCSDKIYNELLKIGNFIK